MAKNRDPRIDAYIKKSASFARPILEHIRDLVHRACPGVVETIKWGMPHFVWHGRILCAMAAFKAHAALGFRHPAMEKELGARGEKSGEAMGSLGRIASLADLPPEGTLLRYLKRAAELNESGAPVHAPRRPRPEAKVPPDLAAALRKNARAARGFAGLSPSARREYIEWITGAKRPETREQRLATTLVWAAAGKSRNWKYERR